MHLYCSVLILKKTETTGIPQHSMKDRTWQCNGLHLNELLNFISFCSEKTPRKTNNTTSLCDTALNNLTSAHYHTVRETKILSSSCYFCYTRNFNRTKKKHFTFLSPSRKKKNISEQAYTIFLIICKISI